MIRYLILTVLALTVASGTSDTLRLCHTNDFHAKFLEVGDSNVACSWSDSVKDRCYSGLARLYTAFESLSCDVRIQAGDWVQGSLLDTIFKQEIAIDTYHWMNYDFAVFGNHEFDYGNEHINETIRAIAPRTTWISSNVFFEGQGMEDLPIHRWVDRYNICWVSILTAETMVLAAVEENVSMEDENKSLRKNIRKCAQQKNVIAINHQGFNNDLETCRRVKELDLVIGAHSHTNLDNGEYPVKITRQDGSVCFVTQAYAHGRYIGVLDVEFDDNGVISLKTTSYLSIDYRIKRDPEILGKVQLYNLQVAKKAGEQVGTVTDDVIGSTACRGPEHVPADGTAVNADCSMGNLVCDAILKTVNSAPGEVPRACLMNGGTLRNSFNKGPVTLRDVINVLPFGNEIVTIDMRGSEILAALTHGFSLTGTDNRGGFPGGLGNMEVVTAIDGSKEGEDMVTIRSVKIGGVDLDPEGDYSLVTNAYIAGGGDGYTFPDDVTEYGILMRDSLQEYLKKNDPYTPTTGGRVQLIGSSTDRINEQNAALNAKDAAAGSVVDGKYETELDDRIAQPQKQVG